MNNGIKLQLPWCFANSTTKVRVLLATAQVWQTLKCCSHMKQTPSNTEPSQHIQTYSVTTMPSCQVSIITRGVDNNSRNCAGREGSNLAYCVNIRQEGKRETTQVYLSLPPDSSTRTGLHPAFKRGGKFDILLRSLNRVTMPRNWTLEHIYCGTSYENTGPGNNYRLICKLNIRLFH